MSYRGANGEAKSEQEFTIDQINSIYSFSTLILSEKLETGQYGRELQGDRRGINVFIQSENVVTNFENDEDNLFNFSGKGTLSLNFTKIYGQIIVDEEIKVDFGRFSELQPVYYLKSFGNQSIFLNFRYQYYRFPFYEYPILFQEFENECGKNVLVIPEQKFPGTNFLLFKNSNFSSMKWPSRTPLSMIFQDKYINQRSLTTQGLGEEKRIILLGMGFSTVFLFGLKDNSAFDVSQLYLIGLSNLANFFEISFDPSWIDWCSTISQRVDSLPINEHKFAIFFSCYNASVFQGLIIQIMDKNGTQIGNFIKVVDCLLWERIWDPKCFYFADNSTIKIFRKNGLILIVDEFGESKTYDFGISCFRIFFLKDKSFFCKRDVSTSFLKNYNENFQEISDFSNLFTTEYIESMDILIDGRILIIYYLNTQWYFRIIDRTSLTIIKSHQALVNKYNDTLIIQSDGNFIIFP